VSPTKKQTPMATEFTKGLWDQNPVLKQLLGLCPTLAVTTSAENGLGMGVATTFVLLCASFLISLARKAIPAQVRIASFIVVIATFVTIVDLVMKAKFPALSKSLGAFIPLIVVNCLILGRQEAFASKNGPGRAIVDGLGMLGAVRELLGNRTIFNIQLLPDAFEPWIVMILPAGAFLTLGLMLGLVNIINNRREQAALDRVRRRGPAPAVLATKEA
jgi:electron transport complex protein RnfE